MKEYLEQSFVTVNKIFAENFNMSVSRDDQGSVKDLNSFPLELIKKLRRLRRQNEILSTLRFYSSQDNWEYLNHFIHAVIHNENDVSSWSKGRLLVPDYSLKDQLTKSFREIYSYCIDTLTIKTPDFDLWAGASHSVGAFVIKEENSNYRTQIPEGFIPFDLSHEVYEISSESRAIWFRRCIASRIARYLLSINELKTFSDKSILNDVTPSENWTIDAIKAFEALLKEQQELGWNEREIPGYVGPDSFYK